MSENVRKEPAMSDIAVEAMELFKAALSTYNAKNSPHDYNNPDTGTERQRLAEQAAASVIAAKLSDKDNIIASLRAELAEAQTWRDAVDDAIVIECIGTANTFPDAAAAVAGLIEWVMKVAVDPAVSRPAADLRAKALREAAEVALNPGFIEARDTEWDTGFNDAKRMIAQAIRAMIDKTPTEPHLEFRPDENGDFDEIVARFADGTVHVETMSDKRCYVGFSWNDGRFCQWYISSGKALKYHHEQGKDAPTVAP